MVAGVEDYHLLISYFDIIYNMQPTSVLGQLNQSMQAGTPTLDQVSGSSPNFDPNLQPTSPAPMPQGSPATMMHLHGALSRRGINPTSIQQLNDAGQQGGSNGQPLVTLPIQDQNQEQPGVQVPMSEADLIIKALSKRLDHRNKMEATVAKVMMPPQEMGVTANG